MKIEEIEDKEAREVCLRKSVWDLVTMETTHDSHEVLFSFCLWAMVHAEHPAL